MLITSDVMKKLTRQQVAHTLSAVQKKNLWKKAAREENQKTHVHD